MGRHYITVTMELSGMDEEVLAVYHDSLRACLQRWAPTLTYADLHLAYQDRTQVDGEAQVDGEVALDSECEASGRRKAYE